MTGPVLAVPGLARPLPAQKRPRRSPLAAARGCRRRPRSRRRRRPPGHSTGHGRRPARRRRARMNGSSRTARVLRLPTGRRDLALDLVRQLRIGDARTVGEQARRRAGPPRARRWSGRVEGGRGSSSHGALAAPLGRGTSMRVVPMPGTSTKSPGSPAGVGGRSRLQAGVAEQSDDPTSRVERRSDLPASSPRPGSSRFGRDTP